MKIKLRGRNAAQLFQNLPEGNALSGLVLIFCTIFSLLMSNSGCQEIYHKLWQIHFFSFSLLDLINDGLMTFFFFVVGLEIKKELLIGELTNPKKALLPFFCALGGMIAPAVIFIIFNAGTKNLSGWAIPTATDIAFSVGILAMLGKRIPLGLTVFLTALAIIDDLGAVVVIAVFYSHGLEYGNLVSALVLTGFLYILVRYFSFYNTVFLFVIGFFIWYFLHHSGVHATIAGVLLASVVPISVKNKAILEPLAQRFHWSVNYLIVPLFALANTAITLHGSFSETIFSTIGLGIVLGLLVGKPLGILVAAFFSVRLKLAELPSKVSWNLLFGTSILAGIGFTMSLFVSFLAFDDAARQDISKISILLGSLLSAAFGYILLKKITKNRQDF